MTAGGAVAAAIAKGILPRPTVCEVCGTTERRIHYHHWSYLREHALDVIPLCAKCHANVHTGNIPEPRTGRTYTTVGMSMGVERPRGRSAVNANVMPLRDDVEHAVHGIRLNVPLTPAQIAKVDRIAAAHRWSRSRALAVLVEEALEARSIARREANLVTSLCPVSVENAMAVAVKHV